MNIVERSKETLLEIGAAPILYLMLALSVLSAAIIVERGWLFFSLKDNLQRLARELARHLASDDLGAAKALVASSRSVEAAVVSAGLGQLHRGPDAAYEAMASATVIQKIRLERRLAFLGTLGANAPFVGLFGTVIGIVEAFDALDRVGLQAAGASPSASIMGSISEALVATAIGLAVAIPAVAAFNYFQRRIKATLGNADALAHLILGHARGQAGSGGETLATPSLTSAASNSVGSRSVSFDRAELNLS